jgi:hypothetical protein
MSTPLRHQGNADGCRVSQIEHARAGPAHCDHQHQHRDGNQREEAEEEHLEAEPPHVAPHAVDQAGQPERIAGADRKRQRRNPAGREDGDADDRQQVQHIARSRLAARQQDVAAEKIERRRHDEQERKVMPCRQQIRAGLDVGEVLELQHRKPGA